MVTRDEERLAVTSRGVTSRGMTSSGEKREGVSGTLLSEGGVIIYYTTLSIIMLDFNFLRTNLNIHKELEQLICFINLMVWKQE